MASLKSHTAFKFKVERLFEGSQSKVYLPERLRPLHAREREAAEREMRDLNMIS